MKKKIFTLNNIKEFLLLNLGVTLVAAGVYFFKIPNNFTTGGVTAISILVSGFIPQISAGTLIALLNLLFLLLGFIFINKTFGFKTIYGSLLFSGIIKVFEWFIPLEAPLTDQKLLELVFAVMLPAIGTAILFNINASTGGTDIAAMILRKYFAIDIGKALLINDFIIAFASGLVFGLETCMFSVLGLCIKSMLVDWVIESLNRKKSMLIVTTHYEEIRDFITKKLNRSATVWDVKGAYTEKEEKMLLTALSRYQAKQLQAYIHSVDSAAFTVVSNTSEIYGKGFMLIK